MARQWEDECRLESLGCITAGACLHYCRPNNSSFPISKTIPETKVGQRDSKSLEDHSTLKDEGCVVDISQIIVYEIVLQIANHKTAGEFLRG